MKIEQYKFYCPECDCQLDNKGRIYLKSIRDNGDKGEMYLSTTFGTYSFEHSPPIVFNDNELVEFLCSNCEASLISNEYPEYTGLIMRVEDKFDFDIIFSRKAGIHKTYVITEDGIDKYGEHASSDI